MLTLTCPLCSRELHPGKEGAAFSQHLEKKHGLDRAARAAIDGETGYKIRKAFKACKAA